MTLIDTAVVADPDEHGSGLTRSPLDALRYDGQTDDPCEVPGIMRAMMPSNVRVLDVGCGTGAVTLIANTGHANTVTGIEPNAQRAALARSRGLDVRVGLLDDAFCQDGDMFDVVMSSDVMEHTANPGEFLQLMRRVVKPDGLLLISVPNVAHWTVRLKLLLGRFDYEPTGIMDATHLRWFTARSLAHLLEQNDLRILEMRQTAGVSLATYYRGVFRWIPYRIKLKAVRVLTALFPRLFGVQHVVKATPVAKPA